MARKGTGEDPTKPTKYLPGTLGKIDVMRERASRELPLFHPLDGSIALITDSRDDMDVNRRKSEQRDKLVKLARMLDIVTDDVDIEEEVEV